MYPNRTRCSSPIGAPFQRTEPASGRRTLRNRGTGPILVHEIYPHPNDDLTYRRLVERDGVALDAADNVYTVDYEQALGAEMSLTKRAANGTML